MFLASPERSVCLPPGCAYKTFPCCATRNRDCLLSVHGAGAVCMEATEPISLEDLALVHCNPQHLHRLCTDAALVYDVFDLLPAESASQGYDIIESVVLPLRYQLANLVLATQHAYLNKCITLAPGAGHHHAHPDAAMGGGLFCDVPLAWLKLRASVPGGEALKALYIDVDVHHANGYAEARAQLGMQDHFFMLDVHNKEIWPFVDEEGADVAVPSVEHLNISVPIECGIGGRAYLARLEEALERAAAELPAVNMVFYMCHLDALKDDPLGRTNVSAQHVYKRDRMVVAWARQRGLPMVIMPSRGYGASSCRVARESMARLNDEFRIWE